MDNVFGVDSLFTQRLTNTSSGWICLKWQRLILSARQLLLCMFPTQNSITVKRVMTHRGRDQIAVSLQFGWTLPKNQPWFSFLSGLCEGERHILNEETFHQEFCPCRLVLLPVSASRLVTIDFEVCLQTAVSQSLPVVSHISRLQWWSANTNDLQWPQTRLVEFPLFLFVFPKFLFQSEYLSFQFSLYFAVK